MAALTGHRVDSIRTETIHSHYPRTIGRNARLGVHGDGPTSTVVTVTTDQGASGWGLAGAGYEGAGVETTAGLVGRPVEDLIDPATGVVEPAALPLDIALHDLAGQLLGQPVHEMLGGNGPRDLDCYDGAIYQDDLDPDLDHGLEHGLSMARTMSPDHDETKRIDVVLANCAADHAAGYRAFKLKIGRGFRWMPPAAGLARDIAVTRAVRAAYPDSRLLVDANDGYTLDETLRYLDAVADCSLYWLEEPFTENPDELARLRTSLDGSGTLLADGEAHPDVETILELAGAGLLDVALMDVMSYGFTAWRQIMPAVAATGAAASPHAWGEPLKTRYAAQLAAGLGNIATVEGVPGTVDGVDLSPYAFAGGVLSVPDRPGFGLAPPTA